MGAAGGRSPLLLPLPNPLGSAAPPAPHPRGVAPPASCPRGWLGADTGGHHSQGAGLEDKLMSSLSGSSGPGAALLLGGNWGHLLGRVPSHSGSGSGPPKGALGGDGAALTDIQGPLQAMGLGQAPSPCSPGPSRTFQAQGSFQNRGSVLSLATACVPSRCPRAVWPLVRGDAPRGDCRNTPPAHLLFLKTGSPHP